MAEIDDKAPRQIPVITVDQADASTFEAAAIGVRNALGHARAIEMSLTESTERMITARNRARNRVVALRAALDDIEEQERDEEDQRHGD